MDLVAGLYDEYYGTDIEEESEEKGAAKTAVEGSESGVGMEPGGTVGEEVGDSVYEFKTVKAYIRRKKSEKVIPGSKEKQTVVRKPKAR